MELSTRGWISPGRLSRAFLLGLAILMFLGRPASAQYALEGTRRPMYAGSWYEADGAKLKGQLEEFLSRANPTVDPASAGLLTRDNPPLQKPVLALVVPHAGYAFSGLGAAYAYKAAQGQKINRVFLLGPSHHVGFRGAALPLAVTFSTPVGDLEVDYEVVSELKEYPLFSRLPEVHKVEHSLEMQLPFIRQAFGAVKIVPIVVGALADETEVRLLAEILKGYIDKDDLVVVSSDFTHYGPRYDYRPFTTDVKDGIRKLDSQAYGFLSKLDLSGFLSFQKETKDTICGFYPCAVLAALLPEGTRSTLLKYYTSQDTPVEDKDNSVSYMSVAFSGGGWPGRTPATARGAPLLRLSPAERQSLLKLARATVESYVKERKTPTPEELGISVTGNMRQVLGAFVTLNKVGTNGGENGTAEPKDGAAHDKNGKELRGCIGHIWPMKPLYQAVIENAVNACSRDYRFNSVQSDELSYIRIEISVLTPPRRIGSYNDIVLGRDGIVLFCEGRQSVFLPFVPTQFGWDLAQTLSQLSRKAGLGPDDWRNGAKFDVFQAEVFEESH